MRLARELFPTHKKAVYEFIPRDATTVPFTKRELLTACGKLKVGKAAGVDCIPAEVVKLVCNEFSTQCLSVFNECLTSGVFPECWKITRLLLLPKPSKNRTDPVKYRPICITNTMGKVLEYMLQSRIRGETTHQMAVSQFGFRPGCSAVDAIRKVLSFGGRARRGSRFAILITLDIKNAFNCVPWYKIDEALASKGTPGYLRRIIQSYLEDRKLVVGMKQLDITAGVPQGSVLGPLLWCMFYDEVLLQDMDVNVEFSCYADDLAILVTAKTRVKLRGMANRAINQVLVKLSEMGLEIAHQKTEAVMLVSRRDQLQMELTVGGHTVQTIDAVKYLGVWMARDMRMLTHVQKAAIKANKASFALAAIMPTKGGPGEAARRVHASVVYATLLYGVQAWYEEATQSEVWAELERASRGILLRVCRGYCSMATATAELLSGIPPIRLRAQELSERASRMESEDTRSHTLSEWIHKWNTGGAAAWTHSLIKDPRAWLTRAHGEMDRNLTQALSGHGMFGVYLERRGLRATEECPFCMEKDTAEHAVFNCKRWRIERRQLEEHFGGFGPDCIVDIMLRDAGAWSEVAAYMGRIFERRRDAFFK